MRAGKARLLACGLTLVSALAFAQQAQVLVIGGTPAGAGDWPYMASLHHKACYQGQTSACDNQQAPALRSFFCGATLIDNQWLLTAAHCVIDFYSPDQLLVHVGAMALDEVPGDEALAIEAIWIHPWYVSGVDRTGVFASNDIALLKLVSPLPLTDTARLATPQQMATLAPADSLTLLGWGDTDGGEQDDIYPARLQQATLGFVPAADCAMDLGGVGMDMLCAQAPSSDSCSGDSGGPLLADFGSSMQQVGIVSWGTFDEQAQLDCVVEEPSVYTRVASYLDWIDDVQRGDQVPTIPAPLQASRRWWNGNGGGGAVSMLVLPVLIGLACRRSRFPACRRST